MSKDADRLADSFAPSEVSFRGESIVALGEQGYSPAIRTYFDMETGLPAEALFEGESALSVVDYSSSSQWALVYDEFGRVSLLDTMGSLDDLVFFVGISNAFEVGFFNDGGYVFGVSERIQSAEQQVTVLRREADWEIVYSRRFPKAWRLEFSEDRSSFVVFQVDEGEKVFTKLERYSATSGSLLSSIDLTELEIEATLGASVKSSASGRYTVIVPEDVPAYLIIDSVDEAGAVRLGLGAYPRVIGFGGGEQRYAIAHGKRISVFDTFSGEALLEEDVPIEGRVYAGIDFSASGDHILLAESRGKVSLIDLRDGAEESFFPGLSDLSLVRFAPTESKAIVGDPSGKYAVLDLTKNGPIKYLSTERGSWASVAHQSGKILLFSTAGRVREYSVDTLEVTRDAPSTHSTIGRILDVSSTSRRVLSERDGGIDVRGFDDAESLWKSAVSSVQSVDLSASGTRVAYVPFVNFGEQTKVRVLDVDAGQQLAEIGLDVQYATGLRFSPDASKVWVVENVNGLSYRLSLFDVSSGELLASSQLFSEYSDLIVHPTSGVFVLTSSSVMQFDGTAGALLARVDFAVTTDTPRNLRVSPDGKKVAVSTSNHRLLAFDWQEPRLVLETSLKSDPISSVWFSESDIDFINDEGDLLVTWWTGRVEVVRLLEGGLVRLQVVSDASGARFGFESEDSVSYSMQRSDTLRIWSDESELKLDAETPGWHSERMQIPAAGASQFIRVWGYR